PLAVHVLDGRASPALEEHIARDGIALLCPARGSGADWCADLAAARAHCSPAAKQAEIEISRSYLGVEGKPARYLLITIAPREGGAARQRAPRRLSRCQSAVTAALISATALPSVDCRLATERSNSEVRRSKRSSWSRFCASPRKA